VLSALSNFWPSIHKLSTGCVVYQERSAHPLELPGVLIDSHARELQYAQNYRFFGTQTFNQSQINSNNYFNFLKIAVLISGMPLMLRRFANALKSFSASTRGL
jgi:hypothetical protein